MKRIKRLASLLLAMVMVLGMTVTAFAADNHMHLITVNWNEDDMTPHTYQAYQIFKGDLAEEKDSKGNVVKRVLSNIEWGDGVNGSGLLEALKADTEIGRNFTNCTTAAAVAEVLGGDAFEDSTGSKTTATDIFARIANDHLTSTEFEGDGIGPVQITVVGSGYYLIKDKDGSVVNPGNTNGGAYTRFLLEVIGDETVNVKSEVPSGDKKVYIDDATTGDANNASIGSHVSYQITSEVPNHVGYNYYYFIMNDTLSEGLTFDEGSIKVVIKGANLDHTDKTLVQGEDYYVYTGTDVAPKTFRLAFKNIMDYTVGADIVVTYSATVNDKAVVGTTGNPNTWTLQYSNNPDDTFDATIRPDGEPGLPLDEDKEPLGETPEEKTLTYVTELDITKYADEAVVGKELEGAVFTLTGTSYQVVLENVEYYREATANDKNREARYYLLTDGTYTTQAPSEATYVEIGVGTEETDTGYIKDANENYIIPQNKGDYIGKTLYKLVNGNSSKYADPNTTYVRDYVEEIKKVPVKVSIQMTTDKEGKLSFKGLGEGEYRLEETVTPAGYNTLDPITIVIGFTAPNEAVTNGTEKCTWTMTWNGTSVDTTTGIFAQDVINQSGSLLPSTGGIGTTIFYVVGAALVIGAGILLVTKKRMSAR